MKLPVKSLELLQKRSIAQWLRIADRNSAVHRVLIQTRVEPLLIFSPAEKLSKPANRRGSTDDQQNQRLTKLVGNSL